MLLVRDGDTIFHDAGDEARDGGRHICHLLSNGVMDHGGQGPVV